MDSFADDDASDGSDKDVIIVDETEPDEDDEDALYPTEAVALRKGKWTDYFLQLGFLGRGKFGEVNSCREKSSGREFAAKVIVAPRPQDKKDVEHEIRMMQLLRHKRIIQLFAAFQLKDEMCLILELVSGGELFDRVIGDDFILTEKACVVFARQICEGVEYMHDNNIIHLDMKPENILCLTRTGNRIKIIDFGLAREYDPKKDLRVLFGTPEFMAPEVVQYNAIHFPTDMWSVGVICYVLLSGLSPFMGNDDGETLTNVIKAQYDFDYPEFNDISEEATDLISKLLLPDKSKRLTATQCLEHPWLRKRPPDSPSLQLSKTKLRKFVYRRKWQKVINAMIALRRMGVDLSALKRSDAGISLSAASQFHCDRTPKVVEEFPKNAKTEKPKVCCDDDGIRQQHSDYGTRPQNNDDGTRPQNNDDSTRPQSHDDSTRPQNNDDGTRQQLSDDDTRQQLSDDGTRPKSSDNGTRQQRINDSTRQKRDNQTLDQTNANKTTQKCCINNNEEKEQSTYGRSKILATVTATSESKASATPGKPNVPVKPKFVRSGNLANNPFKMQEKEKQSVAGSGRNVGKQFLGKSEKISLENMAVSYDKVVVTDKTPSPPKLLAPQKSPEARDSLNNVRRSTGLPLKSRDFSKESTNSESCSTTKSRSSSSLAPLSFHHNSNSGTVISSKTKSIQKTTPCDISAQNAEFGSTNSDAQADCHFTSNTDASDCCDTRAGQTFPEGCVLGKCQNDEITETRIVQANWKHSSEIASRRFKTGQTESRAEPPQKIVFSSLRSPAQQFTQHQSIEEQINPEIDLVTELAKLADTREKIEMRETEEEREKLEIKGQSTSETVSETRASPEMVNKMSLTQMKIMKFQAKSSSFTKPEQPPRAPPRARLIGGPTRSSKKLKSPKSPGGQRENENLLDTASFMQAASQTLKSLGLNNPFSGKFSSSSSSSFFFQSSSSSSSNKKSKSGGDKHKISPGKTERSKT